MRRCYSLPQFALTVLLATPIFLQKGYANALSLVPIVTVSLPTVAQAQTKGDQKAEGDSFLRREKLITQSTQISGDKADALRLFKLGEKQFREDKYQGALITFQTVLTIWQKLGNLGAQGDALHKLGQTHEALGQYQKSLECYQRAAKIFLKLDERENAAGSLSGLGIIYLRTGQYYQAIEVSQQSLSLFADGTLALNNLGLAYGYLGQYEKSLKFHQQAL